MRRMPGPIEAFLTEEHVRIDALLARAELQEGEIDADVYGQFRQALLRHIAMEEKVLLPFARDRRGGEPLPVARDLRKDHGQIAGLLVRSPTRDLCAGLRAVLARHNAREEGPEGLYATCDGLADRQGEQVVEQMKAQPNVPMAPYYDGPLVHRRGSSS
jgi:hypothetical protein